MSEKRESSLRRVVGGTAEDAEAVRELYTQRFLSHPSEATIGPAREALVEKTPGQKELLNAVAADVGRFVERYGGEPLQLSADHIYLFDSTKLSQEDREQVGNVVAKFSERHQASAMYADRILNNLELAHVVAHEMMHHHAFESIRIIPEKNTEDAIRIGKRRGGFLFYESVTDFVGQWLDEAVTEELTRRFDDEYLAGYSQLQYEVARRVKLRGLMADSYAPEPVGHSYQLPDGTWRAAIIERSTYTEWRKKLDALLDAIQAAHSDRFADREAVFDVFARAYFSGRALEVARIIESVSGKESFRKVLSDDST